MLNLAECEARAGHTDAAEAMLRRTLEVCLRYHRPEFEGAARLALAKLLRERAPETALAEARAARDIFAEHEMHHDERVAGELIAELRTGGDAVLDT